MTAVGGHVLIHDGHSGQVLRDGWVGMCVDASDANKFWWIGRDGAERSFTPLQAKDRPAAEAEIIHLAARERYVAAAMASLDMACSVIESSRHDLALRSGQSIDDYVAQALRRDFDSGRFGCLFPALHEEVAGQHASDVAYPHEAFSTAPERVRG